MSKKRNFNENAALRGAWRRIFARSPIVIEVLEEGKRYVPKYNKDGSRSKRDKVEFHCQVCNTWVPGSVKGKSNIQVDHIEPVIEITNITGYVYDWNEYHNRLFCDKSNLQRACTPCHKRKTQEERLARNTIKYNKELDDLEVRWSNKEFTFKEYKKLLSKYKTKTRPPAIKDRAIKLIEEKENV